MNLLEFIATMWGITAATALIASAVAKNHTRQMRELELEHAVEARGATGPEEA